MGLRFSTILYSLAAAAITLLLQHKAEAKVDLDDALMLFRSGSYTQVITLLEKTYAPTAEDQKAVFYLMATTNAKLQHFDEAVAAYKKVARIGGTLKENFYYDFGQALYATQQPNEARVQFKKSIALSYKIAASAYYVGYCSQLLEDYTTARYFYNRMQLIKNDPEKIKQPALFQIAEIAYSRNQELPEKKRPRDLQINVLPLFKTARDYESDTPTYTQAVTRIGEITQKIAANAPKMRNGIPLPLQPYTLRLTQDFEYDSNVITQADDALLKVSNHDAVIFRTSLLAKYQWNWMYRWSFIPELSAINTYHNRREIATIYQNDSIVLTPALRTKYEHTVSGKPATALLDYEYALTLRDYKQQHRYPYYSRTHAIYTGEKAKYFDTGATTIKAGVKFFDNYNPDRNSITPSLALTQIMKVGTYDLSNTLSAEVTRARVDTNDERNYKLSSSITFPEVFSKFDISPALVLAVKDTVKQKNTRGNEVMINPSIAGTKNFSDLLSVALEYGYTKNRSKDAQNYQYTKHDVKLSSIFNF